MERTILSLWLIAYASTAYAQEKKLYKDPIFSDLAVQNNLTYSHNIPSATKKKYYQFDLYQALNDSNARRPLIIWMHGGGFKFGSKRARGIRLWSKSFARRGYLCAAINYRLSKQNPLRNFTILVKSCYEAVQDAEQAIKYFKTNHAKYKIDTNRIILAGNSAGAITALHSVYASHAELQQLINFKDSVAYPQNYNSNHIAAVINFWGALFRVEWLENTNVPIVSVHGKRDRIVPYANKTSPLSGSSIIHKKADSLHISNQLKTYDRYGHELQKHFIPILRSGATKKRWLAAGQFAADFLYAQFWK